MRTVSSWALVYSLMMISWNVIRWVLVKHQDEVLGHVTSGVVSPTLQESIAMAMVDTTWSSEGTKLQVEIGRSVAEATVVPMPFYKRP